MALTKKAEIVARKIHGSFFLIDITDNYSGDKCSLYEINPTGMFLWEHINGDRSARDLAELLQAALTDDVDFDLLLADVTEFITMLREKRFLEA